MNINRTDDGNTVTLTLEGWLDTQAAPDLEAALNDIGDGFSSMVIDCANLEYISSSGIRQIVAAHKQKPVPEGLSPNIIGPASISIPNKQFPSWYSLMPVIGNRCLKFLKKHSYCSLAKTGSTNDR